ncbi:MAG: xanthine dehydrogenase family protein subunit M [Synergistetes bacterium]|nr:xanthine dehydrogenase family protein subunit M [Synergistota bacterium]
MSFKVLVPGSLREALEILSDGGKPIAGGTDLLVRIKRGLENPGLLVDITRIPELRIFRRESGKLEMGALFTHTELLSMDIPPLLKSALSVIGSRQIRNLGTIGGNVVNASPAGDSLPALYTYEAQVKLVSLEGERVLRISDFIKGPGQTDLRNGELLLSILLRDFPDDYRFIYRKVGQRSSMTISIASIAVIYRLSDGFFEDIRIALGSVAPTVIRAYKAEEFLKGKPISEDILRKASLMIEEVVSPISDVRASEEYRRKVSGRLILSLLEEV